MFYAGYMRTTLDIDDAILSYARGVAKHNKTTIGEVISDLAKDGLKAHSKGKQPVRDGFPQIVRKPGSNVVITNEFIQTLLDESE